MTMQETSNHSIRLWLPLVVFAILCGFAGGVLYARAPERRPLLNATSSSASGTVAGIGQLPPSSVDAKDVDFSLFWEVWALMKEKYYDQSISDKDLFYGALAGLAQAPKDPYTTFFPPKEAEEFQTSLSGKFSGIGAEIGMKNEQLQIVAPLPETPAEKAGLRPGDWIVKIDGTETTGMTVDKAVHLIRGPKGTKVTLNIFRPEGKKPPFDVEIIRDTIQIFSVKSKMLPEQVAYIEVSSFAEDTTSGFQKALRQLIPQKPKGIILDLRNNPGGFLQTSVEMAGSWVGDQVVVKERRQGKIVEQLMGEGDGRLSTIPTVVLVNEASASAAEIVAGALQDYGKATVVGMKTFGKGSVQDYQGLPDGAGIKITIAEWVTPKERTINKEGLTPDIVVDRTLEDYEAKRDPQLERAIGILTGTATSTAGIPTSASSTR